MPNEVIKPSSSLLLSPMPAEVPRRARDSATPVVATEAKKKEEVEKEGKIKDYQQKKSKSTSIACLVAAI